MTKLLPKPTDEEAVLACLMQLGRLPIDHHQWGWTKAIITSKRAPHYARIYGGVGCRADWLRDHPEQFEAVYLVARDQNVPIHVNHSPWHKHWAQADPRGWDARADQERDDLRTAIEFVRNETERLNRLNKVEVRVSSVFCDQEILYANLNDAGDGPAKEEQPDQAEAMRHKNAITYEICKDVFPDANYVAHGQLRSHHTTNEPHDGIADTELYMPNHPYAQRWAADTLATAIAKRNAQNPGEISHSMLFVAQGGFYDFGVDPRVAGFKYAAYPVKYDHYIGRESLHPYFLARRPEWNAHDMRGTWPSPKEGLAWVTHLIAYASGAMNWSADDSEDRWLEEYVI